MKLILRLLFSIGATMLAVILLFYLGFFNYCYTGLRFTSGYYYYGIIIVTAIIIFLLFYALAANMLARKSLLAMDRLIDDLLRKPLNEVVLSALGLLAGLIIATLIGMALDGLSSVVGAFITIGLDVVLGYVGWQFGGKKKNEFKLFKGGAIAGGSASGLPKILDTSVIIDGRVLDILKTGFIEGTIIIPNFVLEELRHIADSSDNMKRSRGRLGLDILNQIQSLLNIPVEIVDYQGPGNIEVDIKLLKMAEEINAYIVTNDYNLNKVAGIHKVPVLNINDLSNAVKSIILPGQDLTLFILKEGKEAEQGIGYLNDGTMIVVEEGKKHIGESLEITVTSALQTSAGRMIFAKPKEDA